MATVPLYLVAWYLPGQTVSLSYQAQNGTDLPSNVGALTYTVKNLDGVTSSSGSLTTGSAPDWIYTYSPVMPVTLGVYRITITNGAGFTARFSVEVVDSHLLTPPIVRQYEPNLVDTVKYPYAGVQSVIDTVTQEFRKISGRSFVRRGARHTATVPDSGWLSLPDRDVTALTMTLDGVAYAIPSTKWDIDGNLNCIQGRKVAVVDYEYGYVDPPADIVQAALTRARSLLFATSTGIPDRATSYQVAEGGTYALSTPGRGGAETGIPDVDIVLARYRTSGVA